MHTGIHHEDQAKKLACTMNGKYVKTLQNFNILQVGEKLDMLLFHNISTLS